MLREIKTLGFELIELGPGIRPSLLPGIQRMFDAGEVRFSSLHNFFPLPAEAASNASYSYAMSDSDKIVRQRAVEYTLASIDWAKRLEASFVVLRLGSVPMNPITDELLQLLQEGEIFSRGYVKKKIDAVRKRERGAQPALDAVRECLRPIIEHAASSNIRLGIQARRRYEDIPSERELPELLDGISAAHLGYWHSVGRVQVKENVGFLDHFEWLQEVGQRAFGCEVQDVKWPARDQEPPFFGDITLDRLVRLLPGTCQMVFELGSHCRREEIVTSLAMWKERFGE